MSWDSVFEGVYAAYEAILPQQEQAATRQQLVDEVADIREDAVAQFHAQKTRIEGSVQGLFKALNYRSGQIRLPSEQLNKRPAIGWVLVVAG
jgi:hypothetical protein